jgi:hypothetical protein
MPHSSYSGFCLLHSYVICSLESEFCMLQSLGEKSMEHLLSYKEALKKQGNRHTDAKNFILT